MKRIPITFALLALASLSCPGPPGKRKVLDLRDSRWDEAWQSHVQVHLERLGEVPNCGLLLPAVSPDGKWIASLDYRGDQPVALESLYTGRGLEGMSLHLQPVASDAQSRLICPSGAAWPAWSADSSQLAFVSYDQAGQCSLRLYRIRTGNTRSMSVGLERMTMLAVSPSGDRVAAVSPAKGSTSPRIHVVTLATGKLTPCPATQETDSQLWPQWTADGRIVYVLMRGVRSWVAQWGPGQFAPENYCEIDIPASQIGAHQAFVGLGRPLSGDDLHLAYHNATSDRIVLVDLIESRRTELKAGTRSGCWLDSRRFVAATDKQLLMFVGAQQGSARLMDGPWLPRGTVGRTSQLVLCTRGRHAKALALARMTLTSGK